MAWYSGHITCCNEATGAMVAMQCRLACSPPNNQAQVAGCAGMRHAGTRLLGATLDVDTAAWVRPAASIGAGSDSFHEYLLKVHRGRGVAGVHLRLRLCLEGIWHHRVLVVRELWCSIHSTPSV